jgi:NAD(P)-dependent dehydrogenase (short-subunit alcohol dehydrogenase family)
MTSSPSLVSLEGRVLLVTGALGTIGSTTVVQAASVGAQVMAIDRPPPNHPNANKLLQLASVAYLSCDVTNEDDVVRAVATAVQRYGRLDGAANVAGIVGPSLLMTEFPSDAFREVTEVNLFGTYLSMKHEIPAISRGGGGAIVNVGSVAGHSGEMYRSAYSASKAGVVGLTRSAAVEFGRQNIRINVVSPGPVATKMFYENVGAPGSERYARVMDEIPAGRLATPGDITAAILWLLSDAAAFVHGHELVVDGGLSMEGLSAPRLVKSKSPA